MTTTTDKLCTAHNWVSLIMLIIICRVEQSNEMSLCRLGTDQDHRMEMIRSEPIEWMCMHNVRSSRRATYEWRSSASECSVACVCARQSPSDVRINMAMAAIQLITSTQRQHVGQRRRLSSERCSSLAGTTHKNRCNQHIRQQPVWVLRAVKAEMLKFAASHHRVALSHR